VPRRDLRLLVRREGPRPSGEVPQTCRVILLDVTQIKEAQAVILAQQRFRQSVVDGIADPIRVMGLDCHLLLTNRAAQAAQIECGEWPTGPPGEAPPEAPDREPDAPSLAARGLQTALRGR
jgi:hypothetical protein